jgi:membrane protease YdiL (CAAX protease family)
MISALSEPQPDEGVPFHNSHWKTRWLFVGLAVVFLWRSTAFIDREWLAQFPWWTRAVVFGLIPQAFLLFYPIVTRIPRGRYYIPTLRRCLIEFGIAIPVVIAFTAAAAAIDFLLDRLSPGTSLQPEAIQRMAESSRPIITYLFLVFSFTVAPVAEEVFFRGFLQNAFRVRMPWTLSIVTQSLLFGFCHSFGVIHSGAAFVGGLLLTLVYKWRQMLIAPILVHAGVNAVEAVGVAIMTMAYANSPVLGVAGAPNDTVCVIRDIVPDSAADKAGLQVGDVVLAFNGEVIRNFPHLAKTVRLYQPGDTIPVSINREGSTMEVNVVLQRRAGP